MNRPPKAFWASLALVLLGLAIIKVATWYGHGQPPGSPGRNTATIALLLALVPLVAGAVRFGIEIVRLINRSHEEP